MNRDNDLKKKRAAYVKKYVWRSKSTTRAIRELSQKLFVSERTIFRDLEK